MNDLFYLTEEQRMLSGDATVDVAVAAMTWRSSARLRQAHGEHVAGRRV